MTTDKPTSLRENLLQVSNLNTALKTTIESICQDTDWNYSEIWYPVVNHQILRLSPVWCLNTKNKEQVRSLEQFWECSKAFVLRPGEGLPGRVWSSQKFEWIEDVSAESETYFLRNKIAKAFGVKAGLSTPLLSNAQLQMIFVFFLLEDRQADHPLIERTQKALKQLEEVLPHFLLPLQSSEVI